MAESKSDSKSESKAESSKPKGKTFDVSHPGKSAPSATSRPVIIGHGPIMQDPMMQSEADSDKSSDKSSDSTRNKVRTEGEKVIEAPKSVKVDEVSDDAPSGEVTDDDVADEKPPEPAEPAKEEPTAKESDDEEAIVDSVASQAANKKQQDEAEKKNAEQAAHIAELIENKTYFVPINVAKHQRSNRALIILGIMIVVVFAAVATAYVLGFFENL